jgi:hypothetical protein
MQLMVPFTRLVFLAVGASVVVAMGPMACSVYDSQMRVGESPLAADGGTLLDAACTPGSEAGCAQPITDAAPDSNPCAEGATTAACLAKDGDCGASSCGPVNADASRTDAASTVTDAGLPLVDAGVGGNGATAGAGGAGGSPGDDFSPLCSDVPVTAAGVAPAKEGVCTAKDTQFCYKTCGPLLLGYKSETCTNGKYVEQSGCSFPKNGDYSCYKIPNQIDTNCPATVPQATKSCTVNTCVLCNVDNRYLDSSGNSKTGYCVCQAGNQTWSCASTGAWPCPAGNGCTD